MSRHRRRPGGKSGAGSLGSGATEWRAWRNDWCVAVRAAMVRRKAFRARGTGPTCLEMGLEPEWVSGSAKQRCARGSSITFHQKSRIRRHLEGKASGSGSWFQARHVFLINFPRDSDGLSLDPHELEAS